MFNRGDFNTEARTTIEFGVEVALVDLKRKVMQRGCLEINRITWIVRKWYRQRLVEQADDLGVTTISIGDLEEDDAGTTSLGWRTRSEVDLRALMTKMAEAKL